MSQKTRLENTQAQGQVMRHAWTTLVSLTLIACNKGQHEAKPDEMAEPAKVIQMFDAAAAPEIKSELQNEMQGHFSTIREIERALVFGDVDRANELAEELATLSSNEEIEGAEEEMQAVRVAARLLLESDSLKAYAQAAATLASTCGNCHVQSTSIRAFERKPAPAADGSAQERMQRHQWAMDRLWEGLVGPSDFSWQQGTEVLLAAPFPINLVAADQKQAATGTLMLRQLEGLGEKASVATEPGDRTRVYGELLTLCSSCHQSTRK